jgi:hypothetical protein
MALPNRSRLVAVIAERAAEVQNANRSRWQRKVHPMDLVPAVREVIGIALYDPEASDLLAATLEEREETG